MNRKHLLDTLTNVRPALSTKEFIEVFTCFCFTGDSVFAYDDLIAIKAPIEVPIKGAVKGSMLLDMLRSLNGEEVELMQNGNSLQINSAGSELKLPMLGEESFFFRPSALEGYAWSIPIDDKLLRAFSKCLLSASSDSSNPERMGVTLTIGDDGRSQITAYSTDGVSITSVIVGNAQGDVSGKYVLPTDFCKAIVELSPVVEGEKWLAVSDIEHKVVASVGDYSITSKLIDAEPLDFVNTIKRFFDGGGDFVAIPDTVGSALTRAELIVKGNNSHCVLEADDRTLRIDARSTYGEVLDECSLSDHHSKVKVSINPYLVRRVLDNANQMQVNRNAVVLLGEEYVHLVAVTVADEEFD